MFRKLAIAATAAAALLLGAPANADLIWNWDSGDGLVAAAQVSQVDSRTIEITIENLSTALPDWMPADAGNRVLTGFSFNLPEGVTIVAGSAILGADAVTVNFDNIDSQLSAGDDVSGEWGFGNDGAAIGLVRNFITTNQSNATSFGGPNLDGPKKLSGPQGGLIADPELIPIGGLGAIQGPVVFRITLSDDTLLADIRQGYIEFGSDAGFAPPAVAVPEPATMGLLTFGCLAFAGGGLIRRRSGRKTAI